MLVNGENGAEEIDDKLFDCSFSRQEPSEENLRYSFGRAIHVTGWELLAAVFRIVHRRTDQMKCLQVVAVLRVAILNNWLVQRRIVMIRIHAYSVNKKKHHYIFYIPFYSYAIRL